MGAEAKICGITRAGDAAHAAGAGAAYLGIVFATGPRVVGAAAARAIVAAARPLPVIGVFGAQSVPEILAIRDLTGLAGAQLHGDYAPAAAARLRREGLIVWRVARLAGGEDPVLVSGLGQEADAVLVEARVPGVDGGAGRPLGLELARAARARLGGIRMALAGGLTPESVAETVALVRPDIVDVSSGVETEPGIKSPDRVSRFLEALLDHHVVA